MWVRASTTSIPSGGKLVGMNGVRHDRFPKEEGRGAMELNQRIPLQVIVQVFAALTDFIALRWHNNRLHPPPLSLHREPIALTLLPLTLFQASSSKQLAPPLAALASLVPAFRRNANARPASVVKSTLSWFLVCRIGKSYEPKKFLRSLRSPRGHYGHYGFLKIKRFCLQLLRSLRHNDVTSLQK